MFKDDQMISILTAVVLMVVIGMMIQRADSLSLFGTAPEVVPVLAEDAAKGKVNSLIPVDILANDTGLPDDAAGRIRLLDVPACVRTFLQDGVLQVLPDAACAGEQALAYQIEGSEAASGRILLSVAPAGDGLAAQAGATTADMQTVASGPVVRERTSVPQSAVADGAAEVPGELAAMKGAAVAVTPGDVVRPAAGPAARTDKPDQSGGPDPIPPAEVAAREDMPLASAAAVEGVVADGVVETAPDGSNDVSFSKVVVARTEPTTRSPAPPFAEGAAMALGYGEPVVALPRVALPSDTRVALAAPDAIPDTAAITDAPLSVLPVIPEEIDIAAGAREPDVSVTAVPDERQAPIGEGGAAPADQGAPAEPASGGQDVLAALPSASDGCVTAPAMRLDVRRGAITLVAVSSPCHAEGIAMLRYSGVEFAVPLDRRGEGEIVAVGFSASAPAKLVFPTGEKIDFDLPFRGIDRITRVAVVWNEALSIGLNALEFGAEMGASGHLNHANPRDFEDARRAGGGFLTRFRSVAGIGQNAEVYTLWHQRNSGPGVVKLPLDLRDQSDEVIADACTGVVMRPEISVHRVEHGIPVRPVLRRLPALDCSVLTRENGDNQLIFGAVDDVVVLQQ